MATIIANGNASIMSRAMYDTEDGYFEHALSSFNGQSVKRQESRPLVFGPSTVYDANGEPWESAYWMYLGEHPVPNPIKGSKKKWVSKAFAENYLANQKKIEKYGGNNTTSSTPSAGTIGSRKMADIRSSYNTSKAVSGGINKATNAIGNEFGNLKKAGNAAKTQYQRDHATTEMVNGAPVRTYSRNAKNAIGEAMAYARGAVGNSAAANAARNEVSNIQKGANVALSQYKNKAWKYNKETGKYEYAGTKLGETAARIRGGVGASAVGRAGKAAFKALTDRFDDFKKGIDKYLTGDNAKANRKEALEALQTKASGLMSAISTALGTSEGRSQTLGKVGSAIGTVTGSVKGIARGIASSDIGKAAIGAGKAAYGAVRDKVGGVLNSIKDFFTNKKLSRGAVKA